MQYLGGKAKIAKQIVKFLSDNRNPNQLFIEPFLGGCNILPLMDLPKWGNEIVPDLVLFYQALQAGWLPPEDITEDDYKIIKQSESSPLRGFTGIACSYSGKWFGGYARDNKGRNYAKNGKNAAIKLAPNLKLAKLTNLSYNEMDIPDGSLIYCDPPYFGTTGYKNVFNHDDFWNWVRNLSERNTVFVSEYSAPDDFEIVFEIDRNLEMKNSSKTAETKRVEKIFKYKG